MSASSDPIDEEQTGLAVKLPHQLGRFVLSRELGAGGMATVYLGRMRMAEGFDRLVALKTIHGHLARAQTFVDMFLDEAKIASQISHPNVCSVYDFGSIGGTYFLALEYLIGEPLHELINQIVDRRNDELMQVLPYLAARILADACEGLHAAHETRGADGKKLGIVHRDVSPQNLFVTYDGAVKVVDFGCAKAIQRVTQTDTGIMKGKVSYAAPEQLKAGDIDARVDVWALGVCLWETLTLKELFRRETAIMSAMAVLEEPIPRADEVCSWVPRQLADIAAKALERDPAQRYANARQMGRDLRAFIARSGASFESAELAEWMGYLFAERQQEVLAMVAEVEGARVSGLAMSAHASTRDNRSDDALGVGNAPTKLAKVTSGASGSAWFEEAPASESKPKRALRLDPEPDDPVVLPTRTRGWMWALVAIVLIAGGVYAGLRYAGVGPFARAANDAHDESAAPTEPSEREDEGEPAREASAVDEHAGEAIDVAAGETAPSEATAAHDETASATEAASRASAAVQRAESGHAGERASHAERDDTEHAREATSEAAHEQPAPEQEASSRGPTTTLDTSQGQVVIATEGGWAEVYFGDRALGRTPLRVSLPVGEQRLRLLPYGEEPAQNVVVPVEWGAINRVTLRVGPPADEAGDAPDQTAEDGT